MLEGCCHHKGTGEGPKEPQRGLGSPGRAGRGSGAWEVGGQVQGTQVGALEREHAGDGGGHRLSMAGGWSALSHVGVPFLSCSGTWCATPTS